ncbi:hypothetical protein RZS08_09095, partial [Arthrospira platensis SPKY1]|nr:hypothetical protein [Arthrospira platensis SPKY1]
VKEYPLEVFVAPSEFKSYDELKARLDMVLGAKSNTNNDTALKALEETVSALAAQPKVIPATKAVKVAENNVPEPSDEIDDDLAYLSSLVGDDDE